MGVSFFLGDHRSIPLQIIIHFLIANIRVKYMYMVLNTSFNSIQEQESGDLPIKEIWIMALHISEYN